MKVIGTYKQARDLAELITKLSGSDETICLISTSKCQRVNGEDKRIWKIRSEEDNEKIQRYEELEQKIQKYFKI